MILETLQAYVKNNIIPVYDTFDNGHSITHVAAVIKRSLLIANEISEPLNKNMVYVVAAYHDYGMKIERKNHNMHSGTLLRQDSTLEQWFSQTEIETMAQAVEDHSTSSNNQPRSIYGKIVCDADKDNDIIISLTRALEFSFATNPQYSLTEHFENSYEHLRSKYGKDGMVRFYLNVSNHSDFLQQINMLSENKDKAMEIFAFIANSLNKT